MKTLSHKAFAPRIEVILTLVALSITALHAYSQGGLPWLLKQLSPWQAHQITFEAQFEPESEEVNIQTYLPDSNQRQQVLELQHFDFVPKEIEMTDGGKTISWTAPPDTIAVKYRATVMPQALEYTLDPAAEIPSHYQDASLQPFLQETESIQVTHPEIAALWENIKPSDAKLSLPVLQSIYDYTHGQLETVAFKGLTDALTALRLGIASCNGKSRLFVALARLNHIPARLVGGVILDGSEKRTSHQWVEVYLEGHWIPFGPTNGHFAALPSHYLRLYTGDQVLIKHTSNINFDYQFDIDSVLISPAFRKNIEGTGVDQSVMSAALSELDLSVRTIGVVLLFPLCTLLITFLRNVVGISTFGIFMPMLIAAACFYTGLLKGALGFGLLLLFAWLVYAIAGWVNLLKTARLSIVITCVIGVTLALVILSDSAMRVELGMLSVFPVIIIAFIAERIHHSMSEEPLAETLKTVMGTMICILLCFFLFQSLVLKHLFALFPEAFLLVIAGQIYLGRWSGVRISEKFRFKKLIGTEGENEVMGINSRNRDLIYAHNDKRLLKLAADKLASKEALISHGVPVPESLLVVSNYSQINDLTDLLKPYDSFALKPNKGCQGKGIVIATGKQNEEWKSGRKRYPLAKIEQHVGEILGGVYSQSGDSDKAYFEPLLIQHNLLQAIAPLGLSDIRLVMAKGKLVSAMLRMPTKGSNGKANLHQGAIGVGIDIKTGRTFSAKFKGQDIHTHPDTDHPIIDIQLPYWTKILNMAERCYAAIPLVYLGVDICIDREQGPVVLEVNGRPGLEIQNVTNKGFYHEVMAHV